MDTNRVKRFATEARNILKAGIAAKILTLGFDRNGDVAEENKPRLMQGGSLWNGQLQTEGFYHQWMALYKRIQRIGVKDVCEEAAYTWFNRLCAIRILQKNNLCQPVLAYADVARTPAIVDEARQGRLPEMSEEMRRRLLELLDDDTKVTEQFAVLIAAWCHDNPIIFSCFGGMADYTELLLPNNILAEGGFVDLLNQTEFITDEDFRSPELIGWLYQFYISERKDEVFAKKGKFEADEIPAATQIFTPNWIVKYMVQNTVGRIYLDNNPYETKIQEKWRYLVEPAEKPGKETVLEYDELTDLKVADLACGSGHILNECFDLLYDLYIAEGYSRTEAVENIFRHNLTGVDIDTRARQLATFALFLKACQKDAAFGDAHVLPNVLDMSGVVPALDEGALADACIRFVGGRENVAGEMLERDFGLLRDAGNLGSIMKFNDDEGYLKMLRCHYEDWTKGGTDGCPDDIKLLLPGVRVILALTEKYHALVMNPPYMGRSGMNDTITNYVRRHYCDAKWDLFAVFMQVAFDRLYMKGKMSMINMHSWMFINSFESLRCTLIKSYQIDNLIHLGGNTFEELNGEVVQNVAFTFSKHKPLFAGVFYRLVKAKSCDEKEKLFLTGTNDVFYEQQANFLRIPGCPIGYWLSNSLFQLFEKELIGDNVVSKAGVVTGNDPYFVRNWFEITFEEINFSHGKSEVFGKYHPFCKGGSPRRYYGNYDYVIKLHDLYDEEYYNKSIRRGDKEAYFKRAIGWSQINFANIKTFRFIENSVCGTATPTIYVNKEREYLYLLGLLNTKISQVMLNLLNPTTNLLTTDVCNMPFVFRYIDTISDLVSENISLSKQDWDAHETSWDFRRNELLAIDAQTYEDNVRYEEEKRSEETDGHIQEHIQTAPAAPRLGSLEWRMKQYKLKWERNFMRLHANEEELNRRFIDIYGLQDELTPDVPLEEITILQQGEISIE